MTISPGWDYEKLLLKQAPLHRSQRRFPDGIKTIVGSLRMTIYSSGM